MSSPASANVGEARIAEETKSARRAERIFIAVEPSPVRAARFNFDYLRRSGITADAESFTAKGIERTFNASKIRKNFSFT
jgi:hypothetical protein